MKGLGCRSVQVGLVACLIWLVAAQAVAAEQATFRDLARRYFADGDSAQLSKLTGLSEPVKHVVALDYTILLRMDKGETAVDPKTHEFNVGDTIRVRIQPMTDAYVYIFHEGASGQRSCLLPADQEKPPLAKSSVPIELPNDGYFEFVPPAGAEELVVVATEKPIADLALLSNVVFKKPDEQLTPQEQEMKSTFKATVSKTLQSIRKRQDERITFRGLPTGKGRATFAEKVSQSGAKEVNVVEPPHGDMGGTFAMVASTDQAPNLLVSIPLRSIAPRPANP